MIDYIILPYISDKRKELGLDPSLVTLMGNANQPSFKLLAENNIFNVLVPPNCMDCLQPL